MKATRRALAVAAGAVALVATSGTAASAQSHIVPTVTPSLTNGGWIYWLAFLSLGLGLLMLIVLIALYMRFAPRFSKDEDQAKVVRADRGAVATNERDDDGEGRERGRSDDRGGRAARADDAARGRRGHRRIIPQRWKTRSGRPVS